MYYNSFTHTNDRNSFDLEAVMTVEDFVGLEVRDVSHNFVGTIDEVYCSVEDHMVRYLEITSNNEKYMYPFDLLVWSGTGPAFLSSRVEDLRSMSCYDPMYVFETEDLVTYNDILEKELAQFVEPELTSLAS